MAFLNSTRPLGHARVGWISRIAQHVAAWRQRQHLVRLDDAALKDIGLTRHQVDAEARRAIWDAPEIWRC